MQKPTVLSDITVEQLAGLGCSLQPEAALSPCHTSGAKETSLHPLFIEGEMPSFLCRERIRLMDLGSVGSLFETAEMSSHQ